MALAALCASCAADAGPESPAVSSAEISSSPMRALARNAQSYLANYGGWTTSQIAIAQSHDVVILDPNERAMSRAVVEAIQGGADPGDPSQRVVVLCYISIGEDQRTADLTDAELASDPRFRGDGTGPRIDPRGPFADGQSLTGIDPLGLPSNGGTGFASWYLDDNSVRNDPTNVGDGIPDRNGNFGSRFANAGDPRWFDELQRMTYAADRISGLREILTTTYGRGLGCDGVFLDTFDTAAPNHWTDADSPNESKFEWTAPGFGAFIQRLRSTYPDVVILQNRGLFFFSPEHIQYQFIPRGAIDFVLYESYRLNSSSFSNPDPFHYPDNRFNFAPKLMAEANRQHGFRVLSLGYAEGPPDEMSELTLIGESSLGFESLIEDIRVTERLAGFRHYLTNASVDLVNEFVRTHADRSDASPPAWTSTYNDNDSGVVPGEPTPRVGIQEVVAGPSSLTVRWDIALDLNRVGYALYYQTTPFDFGADPALSSATRLILRPEPGAGYDGGVGPDVFANQATVSNLVPGQTYHLLIRAFDESAAANEDTNQVVLTATPGDASRSLDRWSASNDASLLRYRFEYRGTWSWRRVYIDRDQMAGTGFRVAGVGANYMIENGHLYRYAGDGSSWAWTPIAPNPVSTTTGPVDLTAPGRLFERWELPQAALGVGDRRTNLVFQLQGSDGALETGTVYQHIYTNGDPSSPYLSYFAENDAARIYYHAEITQPFSWKHVFIDTDSSTATGYPMGGVGADYLIENRRLYRHAGPGWSWVEIGSANLTVAGQQHVWSIDRADVGAAGGSPVMRVVFQANGGAPSFVAPIYLHRFSP